MSNKYHLMANIAIAVAFERQHDIIRFLKVHLETHGYIILN